MRGLGGAAIEHGDRTKIVFREELRFLEYSGVLILTAVLADAPPSGMTVSAILEKSRLCAETVYSALERLQRLGLIRVTVIPGRIRPSRLYALTATGRRVARLLDEVREVLSGSEMPRVVAT